MTEQQIDRDALRAEAAENAPHGMVISTGEVLALLDQLDQAEAERDWNWRSSRHSKIERIKANARADRAEAEARAQRRRADDMEDNALRVQTNLRAAEERVDEWRQAALEESAAQPRPLMHETPPAITLSRIRRTLRDADRRGKTIRTRYLLDIIEGKKA